MGVSTEDVIRRIKAAGIPKPDASRESIMEFRTKPDLWGPFWICTTLVIFLSATGNLGQVLASDTRVETDWELVTLAACMMYGALFGVPFLTWLLHWAAGQKATAEDANMRSVMCAYGYSFVFLVPASVLMLLPSAIFRWIVCAAGCAVSCIFVKNHLWGDLALTDQKMRYAMMAILFGAHVTIYLCYRLYFFTPRLTPSGVTPVPVPQT